VYINFQKVPQSTLIMAYYSDKNKLSHNAVYDVIAEKSVNVLIFLIISMAPPSLIGITLVLSVLNRFILFFAMPCRTICTRIGSSFGYYSSGVKE
jgi:hypothetical protein